MKRPPPGETFSPESTSAENTPADTRATETRQIELETAYRIYARLGDIGKNYLSRIPELMDDNPELAKRMIQRHVSETLAAQHILAGAKTDKPQKLPTGENFGELVKAVTYDAADFQNQLAPSSIHLTSEEGEPAELTKKHLAAYTTKFGPDRLYNSSVASRISLLVYPLIRSIRVDDGLNDKNEVKISIEELDEPDKYIVTITASMLERYDKSGESADTTEIRQANEICDTLGKVGKVTGGVFTSEKLEKDKYLSKAVWEMEFYK